MRLIPALLALCLALPGCDILRQEPREIFDLVPQAEPPRHCGRRSAELVIERPKARATLDTDRVLVRPSALQVQYLPDARWGDPMPVMVQNMLVQRFSEYDVFTNVGRAPLGAAGDLALVSEITDFAAIPEGAGARIRVAANAQMVREANVSVVSRGWFVAQAASPSLATEDLMAAFDTAARDLVTQITAWGLPAAGVRSCGYSGLATG